MSEPKWNNDNPQNWETYWEAWYQIGDAKPVCVNQWCHREQEAIEAAETVLSEQLKKVIEVGLKVEAKRWTVRRRHRRQTQTFPESDVREYVVAMWYGTLKQVSKGAIQDERRA